MVCVIYVSHSRSPIYRVLLKQNGVAVVRQTTRGPPLSFVLEKIELVPNESLSSLKHSSMKEEKKEKRADESRHRRRRRHYFRNENVSNENLPKGARAKWWS